jgi:hypothetical protein
MTGARTVDEASDLGVGQFPWDLFAWLVETSRRLLPPVSPVAYLPPLNPDLGSHIMAHPDTAFTPASRRDQHLGAQPCRQHPEGPHLSLAVSALELTMWTVPAPGNYIY